MKLIVSPHKNSYSTWGSLTTTDFPAYQLNPIVGVFVGDYFGNYIDIEAFMKGGDSALPPTAALIKWWIIYFVLATLPTAL